MFSFQKDRFVFGCNETVWLSESGVCCGCKTASETETQSERKLVMP